MHIHNIAISDYSETPYKNPGSTPFTIFITIRLAM